MRLALGRSLNPAPVKSRLYPHRNTIRPSHNGVRIVAGAAQFTPESDSPGTPTVWKKIAQTLLDRQVLHPCDLVNYSFPAAQQSSGALVIDIRPEKDFEKGFIEGSVNVPLYDLIQGWTFKKAAQRFGYAMFGVLDGTELNQSFFQDLEAVADPEQDLIIVCGPGGNLAPDDASGRILPSRSLIAAYELIQNGYRSVKVLKSGVNGWEQEQRDMLMVEE